MRKRATKKGWPPAWLAETGAHERRWRRREMTRGPDGERALVTGETVYAVRETRDSGIEKTNDSLLPKRKNGHDSLLPVA